MSLLPRCNLLASTHRGVERGACSELFALLKGSGDESPLVDTTGVLGLIQACANVDLEKFIGGVRAIVDEDPWRIRYLLRLIPLERVVPAEVSSILEAVSPLLSRIGENEAFRVTVEKRRSGLSRREIIEAVAKKIQRRVSLEKPDWIVLVEIVGSVVGVSVVRPNQLLSIVKVKRGGGEFT